MTNGPGRRLNQRRNQDRRRAYRSLVPFWLDPLILFSFITIFSVLGSLLVSESVYTEKWRVPKYVDASTLRYSIVVLLAFAAGYFILKPRMPSNSLPALPLVSRSWIAFTLTGAIVGHLLLFGHNFLQGSLSLTEITSLFAGDTGVANQIRGNSLHVPGLTTLTQLSLPAVCLWASSRESRSRYRVALVILLLLVCARSVIFSERLALIEVMVGAAIVLIRSGIFEGAGARRRALLRYLPLPAIVVLLMMFTAYESTRSWQFYSETGQYDSALEFGSYRLLAYYTTSVNNGELMAEQLETPPYYTVEFLWNMPGSATLLGLDESRISREFRRVLTAKGTLEFNNIGGMRSPYIDYGSAVSLLGWGVAGAACARALRSWNRGSAASTVLFPIVVLTLMESPRFIYASLGRALPALLIVSLLALSSHRGSPSAMR